MAVGPSAAVGRDIQTLFDSGTAVGLSDRQVLERFQHDSGAAAEAAFEVLVLRHGPMVLRVCQNMLGDATDADDAFQATFLVLVRRCRALNQLESIGGWLYGVACRVAARARVEAARRRAVERRGGLRIMASPEADRREEAARGDFGPIVQEEVRRLPDRYREVVVLCYWEGLTHEQAATQLGCPLGTVRSRIARARQLLQRRLIRRGVAPLAGVVAAALDGSTATATATSMVCSLAPVPSPLIHATVRAAAQLGAGKTITQTASAIVAVLAQHVLWSMTMIKTSKTLAACGIVGLVVVGASLWAQRAREPNRHPRPIPQARQVERKRARVEASNRSGPAPTVEPSDLIMVEVLEALPGRPITGERLVRPDGTVGLGFYGDIHVAGLTLPEIKEKIILHLAKYLSDELLGLCEFDETGEVVIDEVTNKPKKIDPKDSATVIVDITAYNSGRYYVEGDVLTPTWLYYNGRDTVLDALHYVNGLLPSADRGDLRLIRSFPVGSPIEVLPIDYEEITMGTDSSTNYRIFPGDRLVVPHDPKYAVRSRTMGRTQETSGSVQDPDTRLYNPATDEASKQLAQLKAVERHLAEVEKKFDKLIEVMTPKEKAPKPGEQSSLLTPPSSTGPDELPDEEEPSKQLKRRRPADLHGLGRSPFDLNDEAPSQQREPNKPPKLPSSSTSPFDGAGEGQPSQP